MSHWGKVSFLGGGDKIRGAELVAYSKKNMTRDASFIKLIKTRDIGECQLCSERHFAYGQLLRIVEFLADLPTIVNDEGEITQKPATLLLAVIGPVKLLAQSKTLSTPYYREGDFAPIVSQTGQCGGKEGGVGCPGKKWTRGGGVDQ
ncbi:hypothetical protein R3P38DRAFT_3373513 [Favolaschia claudopus]|uniref:Uncharacterized protein n=1 Tax=Favolaschia claudopus TaxID=2862362 RepID=A0AAV9ZSN2_9AGAR